MSRTEYILHIGVAGTARELHELRRLAASDAQLHPNHRNDVNDAIGKRFAELNATTVGTPQPRW